MSHKPLHSDGEKHPENQLRRKGNNMTVKFIGAEMQHLIKAEGQK